MITGSWFALAVHRQPNARSHEYISKARNLTQVLMFEEHF